MALNGSSAKSSERRHSLDNIKKTIDIGSNGSTAALAQGGSILQLSTYHPEHGIIIASPFEQFNGKFWDSKEVRKYRRKPLDSIANRIPGFGLQFDGDLGSENLGQLSNYKVDFERFDRATVNFQPQKDVSVTLTVQVLDEGQVIQTATLKSHSPETITVPFNLGLSISVNRASYGQLTEAGPKDLPKSENELSLNGASDVFSIVNTHLKAHLEGRLYVNGKAASLGKLRPETREGCPIKANVPQQVRLEPGKGATIIARLQLWPDDQKFRSTFEESPKLGSCPVWCTQEDLRTLIIRRNIDYILGCLAVPLADSGSDNDTNNSICLIADHVALPLGWNRDNYWQLYFLRIARQNLRILMKDGVSDYEEAIDNLTKGHLKWVFYKAERPEGHWHRSYLVTGEPKDPPKFQLDQQCYPLLELCDFYDLYGEDQKEFVLGILKDGVPRKILDLLNKRRVEPHGLIMTEETPGDDDVEMPFHFSSNLLVWHTLTRMVRLLTRLDDPEKSWPDFVGELECRASHLRNSILTNFVAKLPNGETVFAYETDGARGHKFYYDANDIPTLFLPEWGFIGDKDEELFDIWHNTMKYGTSPANTGGYFNGGYYAGLGSVHTAHPWPLGYYHEWVYAKHWNGSETSKTAEEKAWDRISGAVAFDGTFSEAVNAEDGRCESKAWFSWPGSMIASELVNDRKRKALGACGH